MNNKTIANHFFYFNKINSIGEKETRGILSFIYMSKYDDRFRQEILRSYTFEGDSFRLGTAMLDGQPIVGAQINVPLCTLNRHGLIAGATGTGKTKTLQLFAENLSDKGVPVLLLDIKGDLSGLAESGLINNKIIERYEQLGGEKWSPCRYPVELLTMSDEKGVRLRSTLTEFGPILLSKILGLNETQTSFISLIFKYSDDHHLPILDLKDFIKILQYISNEGKDEIEQIYGKIVLSSTGTILRKTIELQQQNADLFFGEPSFDIHDLMRTDSTTGQAMINIIRVVDIQDKTKMFSTFMLSLLSKLYTLMPEIGDLDKPKLVMFIDEAHLLFQQSIGPLLQQIETVIKLIRSKGIGIFFCTQNPMDIPSSILAQLGLKIQHALRASTGSRTKRTK
jgi:DNA helicase HerA-like ATPase